MKAAIVTVGDELLAGHVVDTNSTYIAHELLKVGIRSSRIACVGDSIDEIVTEVDRASEAADLVFVIGGLGPTHDDVTVEAISKLTGRRLIFDEKLYEDLRRKLEDRGIVPYPSPKKVALVPEGSQILPNPLGSAPGLALRYRTARLFLLPGVPFEMEAIYQQSIKQILAELQPSSEITSGIIRTTGMSESEITEKIKPFIEIGHTRISLLPHPEGVDIRLLGNAKDVQELVGRIKTQLGSCVYSTEDVSLHFVVGKLLIERRVTLAIAESCTGGLVTHLLTEVPGISAVLERGLVTYSNNSKVQNLGVPQETIEKFGAVSHEVARLMAEGVRRVADTSIGLSTTGIAGPTGGTEVKPVGLVFFALSDDKATRVTKKVFSGNRSAIKRKAATYAIDMIRQYLAEA